MECNKEEAFRARDLAEKKMQTKEFISARKIALKAQQLHADLENISQMLMVCDVHCAADKKVAGNEIDWYGVLQVDQTADEIIIKKQYKKFALLLHPDKNKFPGAESAFKLIGEAQRVLLDKDKRHLHDMKRKASVSRPAPVYRPPQRPPYSQNIGVQYNYRNNTTGVNSQPPQHPGQQRASNGRATFWTACPFCHVKYEYFVAVMNKSLICQTCTKPFVAYERIPQGASVNQSTSPQRKDVPGQGFTKVELTSQGKSSTIHPKAEVFQRKVGSVEPQKVNGKRRRRKDEEESSESCDSDSDSSIEDDDFSVAVDPTCSGERPRRSDRHRQHVSYKEENESDDEDIPSPSKKAKESESSGDTEEKGVNGIDAKKQIGGLEKDGPSSWPNEWNNPKTVKGKEKAEDGVKESSGATDDLASNSTSKTAADPELFEYADPDFNDFEQGRKKGFFFAGQVWAVYDTLGAMPRFYARIKKVVSSAQFKVQITWLEPVPNNEDELEWVNKGLPASCGIFKDGVSETTEEHLMFSHSISCEKSSHNGIYKIFPKKGETWAVIKNWSLEWNSLKEPFDKFEYEFVEILSDYTEDVGVIVAYLGKLKGFVCIFCRISKEGNATFQIPRGELFRFSHMIPSFKLTDKEKQGVPMGSFELDPASLPKNIEEVDVPEDFKLEVDKMKAKVNETKVEVISDDDNTPSASNDEAIEIPEAEFFDFDSLKSIENFEVGQIWSLYSDDDGLPKYYARISKVSSPQEGFKVRLRWLASSGLPKNAIQWTDTYMPICCGRFEPRKGGQNYTSIGSFSHQLSADSTDKKHEYAIMPKKGQIWALYRNWTAEMKLSDLQTCEYDVVEIVEETGSLIKVICLEQVDGFNSVFRAQMKEGSVVTKEILVSEILRFSHQIPAFKLTGERNGSLRGFWELDPAALPVYYFGH